MKFLVDTCGWLEWLTDGVLADEFAPYLNDLDNLIIPTSIQYELHKWICRERDMVLAMEIIELTQQSTVIPLTQSLALLASELSQKHKWHWISLIKRQKQDRITIRGNEVFVLSLRKGQNFAR